MKTKLILFSILFSLATQSGKSQDVAIGQWKDYLSYHQGLTVCQGGNKIYCCCSSGVFSYNLSDNSIERFNKVTGLSDIGCTVARYNPYDNILVVGYSDGNIDLVTANNIINIPDLKNSQVQGSKNINNIYFSNNLAYVSCGQGIMVIDLNQDIILALYYIGPAASALNVYSTTIFKDTIYAATKNGVYRISRNDGNPLDYTHWQIITNPIPSGIGVVYNGIVTCGSHLYASFSEYITSKFTVSGKDTLFDYHNGKWAHFPSAQLTGNDNINSLETCTENNIPCIVYCGLYNSSVFDSSEAPVMKLSNYGIQNDVIVDNTLNLWVADGTYGLVKESPTNVIESFYPPGPFSNSIFTTAAEGDYLYIAPGAYDNSFVPLFLGGIGISEYTNGSWYRLFDTLPNDPLRDLCCLGIDPKNPQHACAGTWGNGVVEYNNNAITNIYNGSNSTLTGLLRVGGVGFDTNGNLWATNSGVNSDYLSVKTPDGNWKAIDFSSITTNGLLVSKLLITKTGAKWMLCPGQGILAYQDNGTFAKPNSTNSVFINNNVNNGGLPSVTIYCMTEDKNGAIWIGTNTQVVVFYSPDNVFNGPGGWDAQNVYVQQTGYTQYLMQNQYSTCIAVDGANRKWIGTLGGGAFLMSADGTQQILNLTAENSPLLSDNILSISIDDLNGEVFFGTDKGMVSYRGTATEGNTVFNNVYAFPDPVPHGYTGPIAIKNLVANSDVKIADVKGEIVYHTVALGGQAIWYGTNFNGERVQTGVYMVYCTSPDGSQSLVTKLLLVN